MCGIGGILVRPGESVDLEGLRRMGAVMAVRGPDNEGVFRDTHVGFVHRRLSILDLSECGNCPMPNEDGSVQVLLNGEIYNWRELRGQLVAHGHSFQSRTDSEVLSHGYEQWGVGLFVRLRGMFAVAIWDQSNAKLLLARDRLGEKPLFFQPDRQRFLFASSIEALREYDRKTLTIHSDAITCYLAHSFIPANHTVWKGVEVVPKAHYCVIDTSGGFTCNRYWAFPNGGPQPISASSAERHIEQALNDSVVRCLDSDVPVGVFLSGGVDSSLVAALASKHRPGIPAFSVGFREDRFNELRHAKSVANHLSLEHHERYVTPRDVLRTLPMLVRQYGQPFGDASAVATYMVSELARAHVKVCLSGDGADEGFAGYWRAQAGVYAHRYGRLVPQSMRTRFVPRVAKGLGRLGRRLAAMNSLSLEGTARSYTNSQSWHTMIGEIGGPALHDTPNHDRVACRVGAIARPKGTTVLQDILFDDFQVQLSDDYLTKVDVASMTASLEVRAPFLDVSVVEAAWNLPDALKLRWGQRKWLLKRIASRHVPREVVYRPKMGFALPLDEWFRTDLGKLLERLLPDSVAAEEGWINSRRVTQELRDHQTKTRDNATRLWIVLWLELWFRIVVTRQICDTADLSELLD